MKMLHGKLYFIIVLLFYGFICPEVKAATIPATVIYGNFIRCVGIDTANVTGTTEWIISSDPASNNPLSCD